MPSKTKQKNAEIAARSAALSKIPDELIAQFVSGPMTGDAVNAATMAFKKALIERALGVELGHHLGHAAASAKTQQAGNHRNGRTAKTVLTGRGRCARRSRATATAASSRCSSPSMSDALRALTTRSLRCTRAA